MNSTTTRCCAGLRPSSPAEANTRLQESPGPAAEGPSPIERDFDVYYSTYSRHVATAEWQRAVLRYVWLTLNIVLVFADVIALRNRSRRCTELASKIAR